MKSRIHNMADSQIAFQRMAKQYDAWYDSPKGKALFAVECACLRLALGKTPPPQPWLEVGVGTGRFAVALGIEQGVDEAAEPLEWASKRGVCVRQGLAEQLPYADGTFGALFMVMTLCFVRVPLQALYESARVLRLDGSLLIGFVTYDSDWGRVYMQKASEGDLFYVSASFHTVKDVVALAANAGFYVSGRASCLLESPDDDVNLYSDPCKEILPGAGFVALKLSLAAHHQEGGRRL